MRTMTDAVLVLGILLGHGQLVRADDPPADLKAVIDKAIQATGGAERLAKHKASTWKGKGTVFGLGQPIKFTGEWWIQPPLQARSVIEFDVNGTKGTRVQVVNGDKGWIADMGTREMRAAELLEARDGLYASWVGLLAPLQDPAFKLAPLGSIKVGERPAVGVKVSHPGHPDLNLYFDQETGLLIKAQRHPKDPMSGQEFDEENYYSDYQDYGGVKHFNKLKVTRDGRDHIQLDFTEYKPVEKLDDSIFSKP
jgi:hypothetical protein